MQKHKPFKQLAKSVRHLSGRWLRPSLLRIGGKARRFCVMIKLLNDQEELHPKSVEDSAPARPEDRIGKTRFEENGRPGSGDQKLQILKK